MNTHYDLPVEAVQVTKPWGRCVTRLKEFGVDCFAIKDRKVFVGIRVYTTLTRDRFSDSQTAYEGDWVVRLPVGVVVIPSGKWSGAVR